ncbi:MAG: DUF4345 domain-containing protein [Acidobacteriaceae bacterium]|nr:DUF4345 domain-containing protein [Acidobacteriaceae bacterium]
MKISQLALITAASGFAGFGFASLIRPTILERVDVHARSAQATTELRAMYGGMELGLGAFFLTAMFRPEWEQAALAAQAMGLGGLAASRLAGVLHDRPKGPLMKALVLAEGSAALLAAVALAKRGGGNFRSARTTS